MLALPEPIIAFSLLSREASARLHTYSDGSPKRQPESSNSLEIYVNISPLKSFYNGFAR
jgi:hypothetical protein